MKKKVLISTHTLRLGGVERSFLGILESIDYSKFEVDVFLQKHDGELMEYLPEEISLLPENQDVRLLLEPIKKALKDKRFLVVLTKLAAKLYNVLYNLFNKRSNYKLDSTLHFHLHKMANIFFSNISEKQYDVIIAFLHPNHLEINKFKGTKSLSFIHTDYLAINFDIKGERKMWQKYDMIAGVSEEVVYNFKLMFPEISEKVTVIENIISEDFIKRKAGENISDSKFFVEGNQLCLLSIGRFSYQKNFDNIPFIAKILKERNIDFKWFIIGFGSDEEIIKQNIVKANVENEVIILGKKENPYPYIKSCDYYIQPSRFEGKAVTVREAQILKKPVFITNYSTANSQVNNSKDGFILPLNNEDFTKMFIEIIQSPDKIKNVINNLEKLDFTNFTEIFKIQQFILSQEP